MKYSRYTSHFIGLVHIFTLYTRSLYCLIHDNCIVDTLPDAYFACYRLAHDDGKCVNCMLQLLNRIDIDCFRFEFFVSSRFEFVANLSFYLCPHISCICGLDNLPSLCKLSLKSRLEP